MLARAGILQAPAQLPVVAIGDFAIEREAESFRMGHGLGFGGDAEIGEGFGHAG